MSGLWIIFFIFGAAYCMEYGIGPHHGPDIVLNCKGETLSSVEPLPHLKNVANINVTQCLPPTSYADELKKLNLNVSFINYLALDKIPDWLLFKGSQLKDLTIKELGLFNNDDRHMVRLPDDVVDQVVGTLKSLHVQRVKMNQLPADNKLETVSVVRGFTLSNLGGCQELKKFDVMHWVIPAYENGWLPQCRKLQELSLIHAMEQTVRNTLKGARGLRRLSIHKCALLYITESMFADAEDLRKLVFTHHSIYGIDLRAFNHQTALVSLDMSNNELTDTWELAQVYAPLVSLARLTLDHNPLQRFCENWNQTSLPIERLSLKNTQLSSLCFSKWANLTYMDLSNNDISTLDIKELPVVDNPLVVNLRGNPITTLPSTHDDYDAMMKRFDQSSPVTVQLDLTLDCDCQNALFVRALLSLPSLTLVGVKCSSGREVHSIPLPRLECDKFPCSTCTCRRSWADNTTVAECDNKQLKNLTTLQGVSGLRKLIAASNVVDALPETGYPDSLEYLDLRDNRISSVSPGGARALLSPPRRARLAGNPLVCDCGTVASVTALHTYREQIDDFESIICVNDGRYLHEIDIDEICIDDWDHIWPIIAIVAVIATAVSVLATLYWKYEQQIKMYLYTRGCCLTCLHEKDLDSNRKYDAFIAFSHEDDDFVNESLLPGLQEYNLCIHYRNWIAGDWIPHQIARSIEQSKRTILVLSKNFLSSPWGMLEFRMAHAAMLQEGRARLIAVVLDEVPSEKRLDAELRGYLAANTYIKWGDPWFFDKLRYALPHKDSFYGGPKSSYYKDNIAYVDDMFTEFSFKKEKEGW